jgi:UDP-N-acetyl-2-amino-2-deoxyglucuronate dehydrogenase
MIAKDLRIAIIGAGRVAQHYRKMFDSPAVSGFKIVGICDLEYNAANLLAAHWGCETFANMSSLLEKSSPDLVIVLTPSGMHFEHVKLALEANCHVLVEKPATMTPADAYILIELANKNSLMLGVAFQNRLNPSIECLRKAVAQNRFGQITTATIRLRWCRYQDYYNDGWHGTWENDGGVINQQAIHHVDALNWLMGPVDSVCATIENRINDLEAEDTMVAIIRFANGALGTIEATTAARPRDFEASLSVVGEKGIAVIGGVGLNQVDTWEFLAPELGDSTVKANFSTDVPNGYGLSHGTLLQATIDALAIGDICAPVSVVNSVSTNELIHALYRSVEIGGWVYLKDNPISSKLGKRSQ